jgi:DNA-binding NarL/FixJ family response regulator
MRKFFEISIAPLAVKLRTYGSTAESMAYLENSRPELLFLDIIMPDKDGLIFLQGIAEYPLHQDTPLGRTGFAGFVLVVNSSGLPSAYKAVVGAGLVSFNIAIILFFLVQRFQIAS